MTQWDEIVDFVIVGSGGGSICAALVCAEQGNRAIILEKNEKIGGSTAMSGGILWIPGSAVSKRAGVDDSVERGLTYLEALVPDQPGSTAARKQAFINTGPQVVDWLESKGAKFVFCDGWSDYHDEVRGGQPRGRSLGMAMLNLSKLGAWKDRLLRNAVPFYALNSEAHRMVLMTRTLAGAYATAKVGLRTALAKAVGVEYATFGTAIQAWMLLLAIKDKIDIRTNSAVVDLVREGNRIAGVLVKKADGTELRIKGINGVLIGAGGFARNAAMRAAHGPQPSSTEWTNANPGDTGEMIEAAARHGAALHGLDRAIWIITSVLPNGVRGMHANELAKPYLIVVDKNGKRFFNEAQNYMSTGQAIYAQGATPCWAIMDSRHRARYPWARMPPSIAPPSWISSGYMKKADSLEELARQCGIDPAGLRATTERFNGFAATGKDLDFHRGERHYDRYFGDPTHKPNPTLGAISEPPFFAVELWPGDVGTYGGIVTDEFARALDGNGAAIEGLYATGNATASVTGASYPGAGASIAASFVFGYRAAKHATDAKS